jgi:hypothetical protein
MTHLNTSFQNGVFVPTIRFAAIFIRKRSRSGCGRSLGRKGSFSGCQVGILSTPTRAGDFANFSKKRCQELFSSFLLNSYRENQLSRLADFLKISKMSWADRST